MKPKTWQWPRHDFVATMPALPRSVRVPAVCEENEEFRLFEIFFVEIFHSRTPTRKDPSFQNQEKSREPLQNPNQLGQQLEILKSKKIEKS